MYHLLLRPLPTTHSLTRASSTKFLTLGIKDVSFLPRGPWKHIKRDQPVRNESLHYKRIVSHMKLLLPIVAKKYSNSCVFVT